MRGGKGLIELKNYTITEIKDIDDIMEYLEMRIVSNQA
jgi:hypothetical protein